MTLEYAYQIAFSKHVLWSQLKAHLLVSFIASLDVSFGGCGVQFTVYLLLQIEQIFFVVFKQLSVLGSGKNCVNFVFFNKKKVFRILKILESS